MRAYGRALYGAMRRTAILSALALALAGCASLVRPDPPEVRLAGIAIERIGLLEQEYRLALRFSNPNDFALDIERLRFDLALNERDFASGASTEAFAIPALGSHVADVTVRSDLAAVMDLLGPWLSGRGDSLAYRLSGTAALGRWPGTVPFERTGRLASP